jgi:hypothetical protein
LYRTKRDAGILAGRDPLLGDWADIDERERAMGIGSGTGGRAGTRPLPTTSTTTRPGGGDRRITRDGSVVPSGTGELAAFKLLFD